MHNPSSREGTSPSASPKVRLSQEKATRSSILRNNVAVPKMHVRAASVWNCRTGATGARRDSHTLQEPRTRFRSYPGLGFCVRALLVAARHQRAVVQRERVARTRCLWLADAWEWRHPEFLQVGPIMAGSSDSCGSHSAYCTNR